MSAPPIFEPGDVVYDEDHPSILGIVTWASTTGRRSVTVAWEHGGTAGGPGLVAVLRHREPRVRVAVPDGALGFRGWNREQAVKGALRRAGVRP